MKKIVIVGGMGYIGSALMEHYLDAKDTEVWITDNRIRAPWVAAFPSHFKFVMADMADPEAMRPLVRDADTVFLLAAQVEAETSIEREAEMWRENYEKPTNLISLCGDRTHIIFPSSANCFGGNQEEADFVFAEDHPPVPKYPYAETKMAVENYLRDTKRPFTILRLGTNYGWAPGIRFNLVANIFTLRALQYKPLTVHGEGFNYRPFCHTLDCAAAMEWVSRGRAKEQCLGEVLHVVSENWRIRDIAAVVVEHVNNAVPIVHIAKEVPFNSYQMSSKRILATGFNFQWTMPEGLSHLAQMLRAIQCPSLS